jgi:hypothetical protein
MVVSAHRNSPVCEPSDVSNGHLDRFEVAEPLPERLHRSGQSLSDCPELGAGLFRVALVGNDDRLGEQADAERLGESAVPPVAGCNSEIDGSNRA